MPALTDVEPLVTDSDLSAQWLSALDQAERYGEQMAWLKIGDTNHEFEWGAETNVHTAYSTFVNQFDPQVHHLLRGSYQSGYVTAWTRLMVKISKDW